jgi:hypothetical protein
VTLDLVLVGVVGDLAKLAEVRSAVLEGPVRLSRLAVRDEVSVLGKSDSVPLAQ